MSQMRHTDKSYPPVIHRLSTTYPHKFKTPKTPLAGLNRYAEP